MEPTLVATACMSMKQSRDPITTGTAASVVGVAAEEGGVTSLTGCMVVAVGVDLEIVVEGVTQAVVHGVRLSDRPLELVVQVKQLLGLRIVLPD
jgi:hypothetical protein